MYYVRYVTDTPCLQEPLHQGMEQNFKEPATIFLTYVPHVKVPPPPPPNVMTHAMPHGVHVKYW